MQREFQVRCKECISACGDYNEEKAMSLIAEIALDLKEFLVQASLRSNEPLPVHLLSTLESFSILKCEAKLSSCSKSQKRPSHDSTKRGSVDSNKGGLIDSETAESNSTACPSQENSKFLSEEQKQMKEFSATETKSNPDKTNREALEVFLDEKTKKRLEESFAFWDNCYLDKFLHSLSALHSDLAISNGGNMLQNTIKAIEQNKENWKEIDKNFVEFLFSLKETAKEVQQLSGNPNHVSFFGKIGKHF